MQIPNDVLYLIEKLNKKGFEGYAVGGCVRDALLGKQPNDWDITTNATPDEMKQCFTGMKIIETGLKHGTLTVLLRNTGYEVTTYRVDGEYTDHRRPDSVEFVKDLDSDLSRRDFTVNAMASADGKTIVDLFGGREDLANRIIRCVGDPFKRFEEDALRILRALRFASVYDFEIEENTARAMLALKETLSNVSGERINVELKKLLKGKGAERILLAYPEVLFSVLPELAPMRGFPQRHPHHAYDVWTHTVKTVANAPADDVYRLAMLFHDSGKPAAHFVGEDGFDHFKKHQVFSREIAERCMLRLKSDTATLRSVCFMVLEHDLRIPCTETAVKKQLIRLGRDNFLSLFDVFRADARAQNPSMLAQKEKAIEDLLALTHRVLASGVCLTVGELDINGNDLKSLGITGKQTGEILKALLNETALNGLENSKTVLIEKARQMTGPA